MSRYSVSPVVEAHLELLHMGAPLFGAAALPDYLLINSME